MAAGYGWQGWCYVHPSAAGSAACVGAYPQFGSDAAGAFVLSCTGVDDPTGALYLSESRAGSSPVALTLAPSWSPCATGDLSTHVVTPAGAAQAFGWGLSGVVLCYLVAWGCGRILDNIKVG